MWALAPLIFRNVLRNKRRSLLTLASTAVSLSLLTVLVALYQGFFFMEDASPAQARRIITRHKVSITHILPASHMQRIKSVEGVQWVSGYSWFQGVYKDNRPANFFARMAVDADVIFDIYPDWSMPADELEAFKQRRTACAVGEAIAQIHKLKVGDRMTIVGDIYPVTLELEIAGIFSHPKNTECLVFHREYLAELLPPDLPERDMTGAYLVLVGRAEDVRRVSGAIDSLFENSPYPTRSESEKEFLLTFLAFFGNIKLFLAAICGAVTFTILLVSANTVAMAVRERTREMAILRTLGYTPGEILQLVLGEALVISLAGGMLGLAGGWLLGRGIESAVGVFGIVSVQWQGALVVLGVAAAVGLLAAFVPAVVASRKNVVASLRFTG